jgi:tight adherence protein C
VALVALIGAVGVFMLVISRGVAKPGDVDLVAGRLRSYSGAEPMTVEELELGESLWERAFGPLAQWLRRVLSSITPASLNQEMTRQLIRAGRPLGLSGTDFQSIRVAATFVGVLIGLVAGLAVGIPLLTVAMVLAGAVTGYWAPRIWLQRVVARRQQEITRALPNALDLLSVTVAAGLGFELALRRVADRYRNALSDEFDQVLAEISLGRPRSEAIRAMGQRTGVVDLQNFGNAVVQSQQLGTGISIILKIQAEEMRRRRYLRARERGARAPLKMLGPMIGCIFPTLWVILLGPAALLLFSTLTSGR